MPYEDREKLRALIRFVGEWQPDEVVHIGDVMEIHHSAEPSKDRAADHQKVLSKYGDYAKRHFLEPLRSVYAGAVGVIEGDQDVWGQSHTPGHAPEGARAARFNIETMLDFDGFGIIKLPDWYAFAPNWVLTHGHLESNVVARIAGNTALSMAKRLGVSVIMGHTHRLGRGSHTVDGGEFVRTVTGVEVGHLVRARPGIHVGGSYGQQHGFGLLHVAGSRVVAEAIPVTAALGDSTIESWVSAAIAIEDLAAG